MACARDSRKGQHSVWGHLPGLGLVMRLTLAVAAVAALGLGAGTATADPFVPFDVVHEFYDNELGGAYLADGWDWLYVPSGERLGPYGGWYDGGSVAGQSERHPGTPGLNFEFPGGVNDIGSFIFDQEPSGYDPTVYPYPRLDLPGWRDQAQPDISAIPKSNDPAYGPYPRYNTENTPVDFLSLPGQSAGGDNTYVVVRSDGMAIDPAGDGDDLLIQQVYESGEGVETAAVSVSLVSDPDTFIPLVTLDPTDSSLATTRDPDSDAYYLVDFFLDLAEYGINDLVYSVKIEGLDLIGPSPGFDLASVQAANLVELSDAIIPEPMSVTLLGLGGLALLGYASCRRKGRAG